MLDADGASCFTDAVSLRTEESDPQLSTTALPGPWRRGVARVLDQVLIAAIAVAIGSITGFGDTWVAGTAVGAFAYFVVSVLVGGSIGKRVLGLAIRAADDTAPTVWSAAAREAFVLLVSIPFAGPLLAIVAWVTIAAGIQTDSAGRAWHDRLGRTVVTPKS